MIVAFPFAYMGKEKQSDVELADLFVRLIRKHQPRVTLVQMTDKATGVINGIDECFRHGDGPHGLWYFNAMCAFPGDEFLRLDCDIVMRGDVSDVFDQDFDIAIARERTPIMNTGVVFVKNKRFFVDAMKQYQENTKQDNWGDIQTATQKAINSGAFNVLRLDADVYNYYPSKDRTRSREILYPASAKIMHFKGARKAFMKADFRACAS